MKLLTCALLFFCIAAFSACENHMDIKDIVEGTPSNADTVLAHKFPPYAKNDSSSMDKLPREFHNR